MKIINSIKIKHNHWNHVVSKDQLRPVMNGVFFDLVKECMVATNSHFFKFTAKNRAIKFSNRMDSRIRGVVMPMTRL